MDNDKLTKPNNQLNRQINDEPIKESNEFDSFRTYVAEVILDCNLIHLIHLRLQVTGEKKSGVYCVYYVYDVSPMANYTPFFNSWIVKKALYTFER